MHAVSREPPGALASVQAMAVTADRLWLARFPAGRGRRRWAGAPRGSGCYRRRPAALTAALSAGKIGGAIQAEAVESSGGRIE